MVAEFPVFENPLLKTIRVSNFTSRILRVLRVNCVHSSNDFSKIVGALDPQFPRHIFPGTMRSDAGATIQQTVSAKLL